MVDRIEREDPREKDTASRIDLREEDAATIAARRITAIAIKNVVNAAKMTAIKQKKDRSKQDKEQKKQRSQVEAALDHCERQVKRLNSELSVAQDRYIRTAARRRNEDEECAEAEELMALDKLQKEMDHAHQRARRVTGTDSDSVMAMLPTEITARRQRTIAWELTACEQMNAGKLMSLTHELRCLESQIPVLEAGLKAMPIRVTNPRCLQSEEVEEDVTNEFEQGDLNLAIDSNFMAEALNAVELFSMATPAKGYHSTAMDLALTNAVGQQTTLRAIVDSGAAWSAIDEETLRRELPSSTIEKSDRHFKDASGNLMKVQGKTTLNFALGDLRLETTVYVFRSLGAPFLLGVNSLIDHGLAISTQRKVLFSEHPAATPASQAPIQFSTADRCKPCDTNITWDCTCENHLGATLVCDLTACELRFNSPSSGLVTQPMILSKIATEGDENHPPADRTKPWESRLKTNRAYVIRPYQTQEIRLEYLNHCPGKVATLEAEVLMPFRMKYNNQLAFSGTQLHSSLNYSAPFLVRNTTNKDVMIPKDEIVATVSKTPERAHTKLYMDSLTPLRLKTIADYSASPLNWQEVSSAPEGPAKLDDIPLITDRCLDAPALAVLLTAKTTITTEEWDQVMPKLDPPLRLHMSHHVSTPEGRVFRPSMELPFSDGGRPRNREDLHELGFSLDKAVDPSAKPDDDGNYPPLPEALKTVLYNKALRWQCVWSRDARTPELSRLVVLDIPTGDALPIAQKPYPIPYQYLEAVRKEVQKLLDGGLIEPCISNWASPVLVRLKKDSTISDIKLKLIIDYRKLNEVTVPDVAGLGNQDEVLHGFGGNQRYCGICDAAGGFYQFLIRPQARHRTAFVLPTSMGGTSFQWRVAPYGLTRNPAGYSRGMMYALKGLDNCLLPSGTGGAKSWIDDISMHADSFEAFSELFEAVLQRMAYSGMSLKASKCYLLHQRLEVLGYYVTPDGLVMQPEKLSALIKKIGPDGRPVGPSSVKEIRTFLGAVQFYRRFLPRLSLLAAPMNALLKKIPEGDPRWQTGTVEHRNMWEGVQQSYEAILMFLQSSAVISAPDLQDPLAEYVICTDACDIAAGGVLLQWQWPVHGEFGPGPPAGIPIRGEKGHVDPLLQNWRLEAGWKLRTIEFYSKTFDVAQQNYATFDQESAAILLCCRKWAQLITCRPTTIYTDSSVASSMLTKHLGPPRLQRWGMELGTFLPYLKIQYRKGELNGMADFLSRFPTFVKYFKKDREDVAELPEEDYADVADIPLFTHQLVTPDDEIIRSWRYQLKEKRPASTQTFWQGMLDADESLNDCDTLPLTGAVLSTLDNASECSAYLNALISEVGSAVSDTPFWQEQKEFNDSQEKWDDYVSIFYATYHRAPVVLDLYCGEGGYSRGARAAGCDCFGVDINSACRRRYETEPCTNGDRPPSCMSFYQADITTDRFWRDLAMGNINGLPVPVPDLIHASPPCTPYSRLAQFGNTALPPRDTVDAVIRRLKTLEQHLYSSTGQALIWQVENVTESRKYVTERVESTTLLCGTMMGHQTFRHRLIYGNYVLEAPANHDHKDKHVTSRGVRGNEEFNRRFDSMPPPNMYGVYSKPYAARGSAHEWHGALGALPNTYSSRGLSGCLPTGYGRLTASQMVAHLLERRFGCPVYSPKARSTEAEHCIQRWTKEGYHALGRLCTYDTIQVVTDTEVDPPSPGPESPRDHQPLEPVTDEPFSNKFTISRTDQLADPEIAAILDRLEGLHLRQRTALEFNYSIRNGILHRRDYSDRDVRHLVVVPDARRSSLMHHYHYADHRGHSKLIDQLRAQYWWPGLTRDCEDFTATCSVCCPTKSGNMQRVPTQPVPTPGLPFSVIHVDHKGPMLPQGNRRYKHILVVVCALTRYTLFIPVEDTTAETTLRALVARVFCVFGNPAVIVSDNGPAFRSDLTTAASKYYGYRHIHTLPYNPQANGLAEAAVKRIKLLIERQTKDLKDWDKLLPMAQMILNSSKHTGTDSSPFEALFGRAPIGLEQLENPSLYPDGDGEQFLSELRNKMIRLHRTMRLMSDEIKEARANKANAADYSRLEHARRGVVLPSTAQQNRYVWLLYGSKENAAKIRKHGHGAPWRHRYKVLEVKPHAVRLEIPTDNSVPRVQEWQPMRRVSVSRPDEHRPDGTEPHLTNSGLSIRPPSLGSPPPPNGDLDENGDQLYEIDRVVRAEKVGGRYRIYLRWKGHSDITFRDHAELLAETSNPQILLEIKDAIQLCKDTQQYEQGHLPSSDDEEDITAPDLVIPGAQVPDIVPDALIPMPGPLTTYQDDTLPISQRLSRRKTAPQLLAVRTDQTLAPWHSHAATLAYIRYQSFCFVVDDYCLASVYTS